MKNRAQMDGRRAVSERERALIFGANPAKLLKT
jgi:hypothetical protein